MPNNYVATHQWASEASFENSIMPVLVSVVADPLNMHAYCETPPRSQ